MQIWFRFNSDSEWTGLYRGSFNLFNSIDSRYNFISFNGWYSDTERLGGCSDLLEIRTIPLFPCLSPLHLHPDPASGPPHVCSSVRGAQQPLYITSPEAGMTWRVNLSIHVPSKERGIYFLLTRHCSAQLVASTLKVGTNIIVTASKLKLWFFQMNTFSEIISPWPRLATYQSRARTTHSSPLAHRYPAFTCDQLGWAEKLLDWSWLCLVRAEPGAR